jgi:hypothetical protein
VVDNTGLLMKTEAQLTRYAIGTNESSLLAALVSSQMRTATKDIPDQHLGGRGTAEDERLLLREKGLESLQERSEPLNPPIPNLPFRFCPAMICPCLTRVIDGDIQRMLETRGQ